MCHLKMKYFKKPQVAEFGLINEEPTKTNNKLKNILDCVGCGLILCVGFGILSLRFIYV